MRPLGVGLVNQAQQLVVGALGPRLRPQQAQAGQQRDQQWIHLEMESDLLSTKYIDTLRLGCQLTMFHLVIWSIRSVAHYLQLSETDHPI